MESSQMKTFFSNRSWDEWLSGLLLASLLILHLLTIIYIPYLNHDVAQYVSIGQMLVDGASPYTKIVDVNPPMIFYISSIPVIIAKALKVSIPITSIFFFFGVVLFSGYVFVKTLSVEASSVMGH